MARDKSTGTAATAKCRGRRLPRPSAHRTQRSSDGPGNTESLQFDASTHRGGRSGSRRSKRARQAGRHLGRALNRRKGSGRCHRRAVRARLGSVCQSRCRPSADRRLAIPDGPWLQRHRRCGLRQARRRERGAHRHSRPRRRRLRGARGSRARRRNAASVPTHPHSGGARRFGNGYHYASRGQGINVAQDPRGRWRGRTSRPGKTAAPGAPRFRASRAAPTSICRE